MKKSIEYTVIIPFYNALPTIRMAIASAKGQTYPAKQIIVVDDGTHCEELKQICAEYQVLLIQNENNLGSAESRTLGAKMAKTSHVALLDADDYWFPEHLEIHTAYWGSVHKEIAALSTSMFRVSELTSPGIYQASDFSHYPKANITTKLSTLLFNPMWNSATTISTECLNNVNFWNQTSPSYSEDYDLIARFYLNGYQTGLIPLQSGVYLEQPNSKSASHQKVFESRLSISLSLLNSYNIRGLYFDFIKSFVVYFIWFSHLAHLGRSGHPYLELDHPDLRNRFLFKFLSWNFSHKKFWSIFKFTITNIITLRVRDFTNKH